MVSPEARVQFSDSQRFKELSSILPIDKHRSKQGRSTGHLPTWGGRSWITRGGSETKKPMKYTLFWDLKSGAMQYMQ